MQRAQGTASPYEVFCHHCRVTFPVEARRCIHCGGPLAARQEGAGSRLRSTAVAPPSGDPTEAIFRPPSPADEGSEEPEAGVMLLRRFGGLALWALIALSAVLSNLCSGRE
jgi:hypothetical protein